MTRRQILRLAGLLAALALVWSATAGILWNASASASEEDRFAAAERLVFYRVEPGRSVRLQLPAGSEAVRLVTHLVLPEGSTYAPERQYLYGMRMRLVDEERRARLEQPLFTRTRQSKADPIDGVWRQESAFATDPAVQITDEREFFVDVPRDVRSRPATLELAYAGERGALLLRAYARFDRTTSFLGATKADRRRRAEARAERTTFVPWEKLSPATQHRLAQERWERLDALGEPGREFLTEAVHRTDFRLPLVEVDEAADERLIPGRAIALNVQGPVRLWVWIWRSLPDPKAGPAGPVNVVASGDGTTEPLRWHVQVPSAEPVRQPIDVPAGVHTVALVNAGHADLRFTVEGPRYAWIAPEELKARAEGPQIALLPDVRRMDAYIAGPACDPIAFEIGERADDLSRLFRIDARTLSGARSAEPLTVEVEVLDGRNRRLGHARFDAASQTSGFEFAELPLLPEGHVPCATGDAQVPESTVEVTRSPVEVSEVSSARVFAPSGARRLLVRASRPAAVQAFGFLASEGGAVISPPYADHPLTTVKWRHAPVERTSWHLLRPANHGTLANAGAEISLRTQVRLDTDAFADRAVAPTGPTITLRPAGAPASRDVLEPETDPRDLRDAARGLYARIAANEPVRLLFRERTPTRPELRLETTDPSALGKLVRVEVDGRTVRRFRLRTSRWRELLPPMKPGEREIVLRTDAGGLSATINRPPAPSETRAALRERTVYRVAEGLRVPVRKGSRGEVTVNVVLYSPEREGSPLPALAVRIDGGTPRRNAGLLVSRLTRASRQVPLPASDRDAATLASDSSVRWYPRTVQVTLGEDLAPGLHWLEIVPLTRQPLWARFFVFGEDGRAEEPQQWIRPGWGGEDAP